MNIFLIAGCWTGAFVLVYFIATGMIWLGKHHPYIHQWVLVFIIITGCLGFLCIPIKDSIERNDISKWRKHNAIICECCEQPIYPDDSEYPGLGEWKND